MIKSSKTTILAAIAGGCLLTTAAFGATDEPTVVELTQVACQFVESENGVDRMFETQSAEDCKAINSAGGEQRAEDADVITLKPGRYVFRVTNQDVPYELGFWLRGAGIVGRVSLPSVSGGGLVSGATKDYEIVLEEGEYFYSCPLNPTPDYRLVVEG